MAKIRPRPSNGARRLDPDQEPMDFDTLKREVQSLHAQGLTDTEMGLRLNESRGRIANTRRKSLGLEPNSKTDRTDAP